MCPEELAVYLKERTIVDLEQLAVLADKFLEAHSKTFDGLNSH